jgi:hypothetical protein
MVLQCGGLLRRGRAHGRCSTPSPFTSQVLSLPCTARMPGPDACIIGPGRIVTLLLQHRSSRNNTRCSDSSLMAK